jgi:WD40 repeat protein
MWCSSGDTLRVYDTESGKIVQMIEGKCSKNKQIRCVLSVGTNGDRQIWCGSTDNNIQVFDAQTYNFIKVDPVFTSKLK